MAGSGSGRRLDHLRQWLAWRAQSLGLVIVVAVLGVAAFLAMPFAKGTNADGTVVEFRKLGRKGVDLYAVVDAFGQKPVVRLDDAQNCQLGSVIRVHRKPTLIGPRYSAPFGCRRG